MKNKIDNLDDRCCNKCDFEFQEIILDDDGKPFIPSHYCINNTWYSATDDCHYDDDDLNMEVIND